MDMRIQGYREYRDTGIQGIQGYWDTGIQGYRDTRILGYRDTELTDEVKMKIMIGQQFEKTEILLIRFNVYGFGN